MAYKSPTVSNVDEFLKEARDCYSFGLQFDKEDRTAAIEDTRFASGEQWEKTAREARLKAKRPCLTENRLPVFISQVVNDGRQTKPAIRITPMDNGTPETAEMYQGRIRQIEYDSDAEIAYDTSRQQQITCGRGWHRLRTEYVRGSMKQRICIEAIENQFSVVDDPAAVRYDRTDSAWRFISSVISKEEHERRFGKDTVLSQNGFFATTDNPAPDWIGVGNGDLVQVSEYWRKKFKKCNIVRFSDGSEGYEDEAPEGATVSEVLRVEDCWTVCQYIINGCEILDETEWIGSVIPQFPVWGRYEMVDGKRKTYSLIRNAKDPQKLLNLYVSNIAEQIAQMPKSPYIMAEGQATNHESEWADANNTPRAYLLYKPISVGQQPVPPPQRVVNEPPIQALVVGYSQQVDAIKAAMGLFDASLGNKSNETAGIAIEKRQKEADNANFHFHDNEARTRKAMGRALLELIDKIDAGADQVTVRDENGKTSVVPLGVPHQDANTGRTVVHQLNSRSYGLAVSTGPSLTSQRQEAFETYSQIASADKNFMSLAGDILFRNLDAPGSEEIAERYEKALPPALQPRKPGQQPIPPEAQQALAQAQNNMRALNAYAQQLEGELKQMQMEKDAKALELEGRKDIERMKIEAQLTVAEINTKAQALNERLGLVMDMMKQLHVQAHEAGLQAQEQAHERDQAAMAQQAAQQQAEQQQQQNDQQPKAA